MDVSGDVYQDRNKKWSSEEKGKLMLWINIAGDLSQDKKLKRKKEK